MMKFIKKYYLLLLLIITLTGSVIYGTYAMFTSEIGIDAFKLEASSLPVDQEIMEYEKITINANDSKTISLNISNSTNQTLHYGAWYQMISPSTINDDITIAKLTDSPDETSGTIDGNSNKNVYIYIGNNSSSAITLYVGIKYSETSSLGLPSNRTLVTGTREGKYVVGVAVTNGTVQNGVTITNMLEDGNFENSGWSNCIYNTTYKKYGNYSCQLNGSSTYPENTTTHTSSLALTSNHYYYARVEGYQINKTGNQEFQTYFPVAEPFFGGVSFGVPGKWNVYSVINNRTSFADGNNYQLRFDYNNNYNEGTVYYDGGMLFDLTSSYGSNYPSKEILDRSIGYFDGSVSYNYQKLNKGNSVTFNVTPSDGYEFESVSCTNSNANYNGSILTISNITGDVSCNVNFKKKRTSSEMLTYLGLTSNGIKNTINNVSTTDEGVWGTEDDYGTSYYFRGAITDNYVYFANYYWRIIRINGNGSIRLIYDGTSVHANGESSSDRQIGTSMYNISSNDNAYVGYMYGSTGASSYSATHSNTNDSTIKISVDNWYKTNIIDKGYSIKIEEDAIYCNDRSIALYKPDSSYNNLGYGINPTAYKWYWGPWNIDYNQLTLKCPQLSQDGMSSINSSKGNKVLNYPVSLLTLDEVIYGGGWANISNTSYYLYTGQAYWTISPSGFFYGYANLEYVRSDGNPHSGGSLASNVSYGVRPVLSLKSSVELTGSGTMTDPWVVQ